MILLAAFIHIYSFYSLPIRPHAQPHFQYISSSFSQVSWKFQRIYQKKCEVSWKIPRKYQGLLGPWVSGVLQACFFRVPCLAISLAISAKSKTCLVPVPNGKCPGAPKMAQKVPRNWVYHYSWMYSLFTIFFGLAIHIHDIVGSANSYSIQPIHEQPCFLSLDIFEGCGFFLA